MILECPISMGIHHGEEPRLQRRRVVNKMINCPETMVIVVFLWIIKSYILRSAMKLSTKIFSGAALILGGVSGSLYLAFGAALNQEKDTAHVFRAIAQSHLSGHAAVAIQPGNDRWLVRNVNGLNRVLKQRGFVYRDRAGALIMYQSETQRLNVSCGMFSRFYMICEAEKPGLN
jgi:hypothetical protein